MIGAPDKSVQDEINNIEVKLNNLYLHRQRSHYYQDSNYFTPLISSPHHKLAPSIYFSIMFNSRTAASVNSTSEMIYKNKDCQYYKLVQLGDNKYLLKSNLEVKLISPEGTYQYVITNEIGKIIIRIGRMPHFYLNEKRFNHVIVAGDIVFKRINGTSEIIEINDQSGAYHVKDFDKDIYELKLSSIKEAINKINIPLAKFKFYAHQISEDQSHLNFGIKRTLSSP